MKNIRNKKILIIEELSVCNFLFFYLTKDRDTSWVYIHFGKIMQFFFRFSLVSSVIGKCIKKIEYADLPGSYFAAEDEGYLNAVDSVFDIHENNLFMKICREFCTDPLYTLALKKEFFNRYTQRRIKSFTILKYILDQNQDTRIRFIPLDSEDILSQLSDPYKIRVSVTVPGYVRVFLNVKKMIVSLVAIIAFPFLIITITARLILRGINMDPQVQKYSFALDNFNSGINWKNPYEFFVFYDFKEIHPKETLQLVRNTFDSSENARRTEAFFKTQKYPWVEFDKIRVPVRVVKTIIIKNFLSGGLLHWAKYCFSSAICPQFLIPALAVMKMRIEAEIFYHQFAVKVFIARDEYSPYHIVRTAVAKEYGYKTVGFSHGDDCHHTASLNFLVFDEYATWGNFYLDHLKKSLGNSSTTVIGAGIYGLDKTHQWQSKHYMPEKYRQLKTGNTRIIGIFASSFTPELYITRKLTLKFYRDVLDLTERYSNCCRVIKPKGNEFDDPEFMDILAHHKNVILEKDMWTYRLLTALDSMICINISTVGLEGLVCGKTVFYYDVSNNLDHHIYTQYDLHLVAFNRETLGNNLNAYFSENHYMPDETIRKIVAAHAYRFDGQVVGRFRQVCLQTLGTYGDKMGIID